MLYRYGLSFFQGYCTGMDTGKMALWGGVFSMSMPSPEWAASYGVRAIEMIHPWLLDERWPEGGQAGDKCVLSRSLLPGGGVHPEVFQITINMSIQISDWPIDWPVALNGLNFRWGSVNPGVYLCDLS